MSFSDTSIRASYFVTHLSSRIFHDISRFWQNARETKCLLRQTRIFPHFARTGLTRTLSYFLFVYLLRIQKTYDERRHYQILEIIRAHVFNTYICGPNKKIEKTLVYIGESINLGAVPCGTYHNKRYKTMPLTSLLSL